MPSSKNKFSWGDSKMHKRSAFKLNLPIILILMIFTFSTNLFAEEDLSENSPRTLLNNPITNFQMDLVSKDNCYILTGNLKWSGHVSYDKATILSLSENKVSFQSLESNERYRYKINPDADGAEVEKDKMVLNQFIQEHLKKLNLAKNLKEIANQVVSKVHSFEGKYQVLGCL